MMFLGWFSLLSAAVKGLRTTDLHTGVAVVQEQDGGRLTLEALDFFMPMQGYMMSLTVDGETVFDQASSTLKFPVVCTPAFYKVSGWSRGLDVNVAGLTWFWVWMDELHKDGRVSPNCHGYSSNNMDATAQMMEGLKRWLHLITVDGIHIDAQLTIRSNANTVEISGNGTQLIFSKERIEGTVIKYAVDGFVYYEQGENSKFPASWGYDEDEESGLKGWMINIPTVVQFKVNTESSMRSDTAKFENKFEVSEYMVFEDDTGNMDEMTTLRTHLNGEDVVEEVSIDWNSHKTIKIVAHMGNGRKKVEIEFTRGSTTARADYYDTLKAA